MKIKEIIYYHDDGEDIQEEIRDIKRELDNNDLEVEKIIETTEIPIHWDIMFFDYVAFTPQMKHPIWKIFRDFINMTVENPNKLFCIVSECTAEMFIETYQINELEYNEDEHLNLRKYPNVFKSIKAFSDFYKKINGEI
jgi:hypothetical protein